MDNKRNGLSGIYFMHAFEGETKPSPTCFEDCPQHKQDEILKKYDRRAVHSLVKMLASTLHHVSIGYETLQTENDFYLSQVKNMLNIIEVGNPGSKYVKELRRILHEREEILSSDEQGGKTESEG